MFGENMSVKLVLNTFTYKIINSFTNKIKPSPLNANLYTNTQWQMNDDWQDNDVSLVIHINVFV